MSDGATDIPVGSGELRLLEAVGRTRHLVARCGAPACGRAVAIDPRPWVNEGLGGAPLSALWHRVRCVCGSRQAELEVRSGPYVPALRPDLFIFH